jgi:hypothetical protein
MAPRQCQTVALAPLLNVLAVAARQAVNFKARLNSVGSLPSRLLPALPSTLSSTTAFHEVLHQQQQPPFVDLHLSNTLPSRLEIEP